MSFGAFDPQRQEALMSDINVTPMVDVMLVLLVIFILAAPLFTHQVRLDLPQAGGGAAHRQARGMAIAIDAAGVIYLDAARRTLTQLDAHFARAARSAPQPEVQLRADRNTRYEVVAQVMARAQSRGLTKIVFVTEPGKENQDGKR